MSKPATFIDTFSGGAAMLPKGRRTPDDVLAALKIDPRVSCFDMSESAWLRGCIDALKKRGAIIEAEEPYPWIRYKIQEPA